ncbi:MULTISPECIES: cytochrome P450 [unclassified Novosphingobium]|uniref:cytochrome P450 n=1 Tax=unclassified Novosphingobium TaxID=2644732 RepID=UPI0006C830B5|nr:MULTISPECIES: cytochrome P450 [unclassified Novosphingobium]KPH58079.1 cytochrome P450 [Novosphingobium sp. ST904]MPS68065.1 cytochrome P450 [Novosphingobium sp.]TCM41492.1 cytochrome P450 [Novosphingobium sp. ST904]
MTELADRDYFTDHEILVDPYAYFEAVRGKGGIYRPKGKDYLIVTGFEETLEIMRNSEDFSAIIGLQGASAPLPFTPRGCDITAEIEAHREAFHGGDLLVNLDDNAHLQLRSLVNRLFTPSRLKANEAFIQAFSDELARDAVANGSVELVRAIATPFVTLVIADLLGIPAEDRQRFIEIIENAPPPGNLDGELDLDAEDHPFVIMGGYFAQYVADRRANPTEDILSELANARYPDGTLPDEMAIVKLGMFMFGAGQDTSAKLLGNAMRFIVDQPGLQDRLRADPALIPALIEEVLRLEGSTKQTARLARKDTKIGDLEVPAGTKIMLAIAAANRDPARWEDPQEFRLNRPKIREHVAFGRSAHTCAGAPLARVEVRIILEKLLRYTSDIDLDPAVHGPRGARKLDFEPSFIIRGLAELHLKLTPADGVDLNAAQPSILGKTPAVEASPSPVAPAGYSTAGTRLAVLLKDEAAKAVLDAHFPGITADKRIGMAKSMTLRAIQKFAPGQFTNEALDAVDLDLAALPTG